ncbi:MAG: putative aminohydrolase SsnA [Firmicutes bacterium]|jgi:putative selenium metabolism protein SsnA|nr:putative aminohydrolase SsnA [Bacillota bacterium]MDH7496046.1 putative aminohydrolase SsnA [Bacillota bacterium]
MIVIGGGFLITLDSGGRVLDDGAIAIEDGVIREVGVTSEIREHYPGCEFVDAGGRVIMPGMINGHMHLYSTFARGMALKDAPPRTFMQILERLWWRLDKALGPEDVYVSALVPLMDCVRCGTTTILDHHASPMAVPGILDEVARAVEEAGIRACLSYEVSDRDGEDIADQGIRENARFIRRCRGERDGRLAASFGLHAQMTLSDATLAKCREAAEGLDVGFHVHVAEGPEDVEDALAKSGKRVVERLDAFGILGPKTIAAHCVHVNEREMDILRERGVNVVHNPESNMGNAVGVAPVARMMGKGVRVGLGTDGYTADMFESVKVANVLHKLAEGNPSAAWAEVPAMAFANNREIARRVFGLEVGTFEAGAAGDAIIVDYRPPTPLDSRNYYSHVLFGMSGGLVDTTIVAGRVLMRGRKLTGLDEERIVARSRELARKVWERF